MKAGRCPGREIGRLEGLVKNWKAVVGKLLPWALGAVAGLLAALELQVAWYATAAALLTGAVQLVLSLIPDKA
jgi:hypothetical protein